LPSPKTFAARSHQIELLVPDPHVIYNITCVLLLHLQWGAFASFTLERAVSFAVGSVEISVSISPYRAAGAHLQLEALRSVHPSHLIELLVPDPHVILCDADLR